MPRRIVSRLLDFASRRPMTAGGNAAVLLAVLVSGFLWFRPEKLIVDNFVDEGLPEATPADTSPAEVDTVDNAENATGKVRAGRLGTCLGDRCHCRIGCQT